jgi:hypothetical protein
MPAQGRRSSAMAEKGAKVRRLLHFKFSVPAADPAQVVTMMKALAPFYEMFGGMRVRLLQNADDPTKFIQVLDYETPESMEANRQQIASDPRVQGYLQAWRAMVPGGIEMDVYCDVTG